MNKAETAQQLTSAANKAHLMQLGQQIDNLSQSRQQSAHDLAALIEPLAQAMAALTDETRQTLLSIEQSSRTQAEQFQQQTARAAQSWTTAATQTGNAANRLQQAVTQLHWTHYLLVILTGMLTAALVSAFWLWLAPPSITNRLDAKQVAEYLKPAVIEALKRSKNK